MIDVYSIYFKMVANDLRDGKNERREWQARGIHPAISGQRFDIPHYEWYESPWKTTGVLARQSSKQKGQFLFRFS
jgi:hypothetical protein